ncbi:Gfo/Idh/MocA family oxidoreductase [Pullulanibacillus sp. KACC 23026]|uniref:Gfo/Idh/MocA family protein n=1 Tax=Pullulanibacillus sp. KACC 23026 TaxID=3028315 RepID=UPI0023AFEBC0|nr:Gfo/Idh/MocA family oxidoreductase [Pullulanibacillus sp. KACC 23026]WEG10950.1 Gfo/Idh/MocA family oxidoreductase [Pullulanibacillus sp. KACC 23026]
MIAFSIIGGSSFRAQYYLRIAQALPKLFQICGMVVRNEDKGQELEKTWNVSTYRTLEQLLEKENPNFIVVSVSGSMIPSFLLRLGELGIPALSETPPAPNLEALIDLHEKLTCKGAKIQVAEQYHLHPVQQARLSLIKSGRLGNVTQATVSISHFYHGVSLLRRMLGIGFEEATIKGMHFSAPITSGPDRSGPPKEEKLINAERDLAWLDFGDKLGIYDFTKDQHRSWIRSNHLSVRGDRGEIFDNRLTYLADYTTPIYSDLKRINKGEEENQEGYYLEGILSGNHWIYRNPFFPARLYDDELAIAECLVKMSEYMAQGTSFYSLAEASQDQYLGLMIEKAIRTQEAIRTSRQPWAE